MNKNRTLLEIPGPYKELYNLVSGDRKEAMAQYALLMNRMCPTALIVWVVTAGD